MEQTSHADVTEAMVVALAAKYEQYQARRPDGAVYRIALDEVRRWRPVE